MKLKLLIVALFCSVLGWGQVLIPNSTPVTQNFDAMGTSVTASLPTNWKMSPPGVAAPTWAAVGNVTAVTQQASSGAPNTGARYNWGDSGATNRALGVITSGGFASPNSIMAHYRNTNTGNLTQLTVSYNLERYRVNTASASVQFYYSLDGSTWTAVASGDVAAASLPVGPNAYNFTPGLTVNVAAFNITGLNISTNGDIYLRWNLNTTGGNSQGIGIDDVSVTALFTAGCSAPTTQASVFTSSSIAETTATTGWTRGNGDNVLVVARAGGAVNADPVSGTTYTANAAFGSGDQIGTGNFVVYNGAGTSVNLTALTAGTTYHFAIYEYNNTGNCYNLVELVGNFTTPAPILTITPATTNLGASCVGISTTPVVYTITNSGTVAANGVTVISSGTHAANFVVSGLSSTTIAAGGTATYTVTFTPSATGVRNATITVASTTSGSNSPATALTGTGNATVSAAVTSGVGATAILDVSATLNGNVTNLGTCPAVISKGFVYSETAVNATPTNGGTGVTTTSGVAVGGTGAYSEGIVGLSPNTNYTYCAYVFDGVNYTYSPIRTFTTIGVPVVSNGSFSGTAGTAITTFNLSTLSTNSPTSYAITSGVLPAGLSLNTTTGAITGTPTDTGTFIINFSATNVIGTSATSGIVTITINPTQNSDIVAVAGSSPATISSTVNTATISTVTDGVQVWSFTIRDGGASSDADNLPTTLTALTITQGGSNSISNWTHAIQSVALFDGSTFVANGTINANNIVFSGISVLAPDNGSKTLTMRLSLTCPLGTSAVDGNDFDFSITQANITFLLTGSGKNTGAPVASTPDNSVNFIQVIATSLSFTAQPTSTGVTVAMPNVVVTATDACGNRDLNFTGAVTLNSTGTITGAPLSVNAVAGVATFSNIIHSVIGTNYQMTASALGLTNGLSNLYDIFAITQLQRGDLAIIAVNTDIGSGTDQIAFVCFEDILPGTTIFLTDNGYERQFSGLWGGTEGLVTITRTGSVLLKGTIVVFESTTANVTSPSHFDIYTCGSLDANWNKTALSGTSIGGFNLNSDDDIWIMQGGTWINDTGHQSTYNGNVLYGWSESGWNTAPGGASQDTRWSTVIDGLE